MAAHLGLELKEIYDKDRAARLAYSPLLHHLVAVNTFYSRLVLACRKREGHRVEWWGEARIRRRWGSMVVPDGFGYIETPGRALSVFLELDLGTEPLGRLTRKLTGYSMAARTDDAPDLLLFCFPSPAREAHARKVLSSVGITTVTSQLELHKSGALEDIWLPLQSQTRYSLLEVPLGATPVGSRKAGVEL